jgi:hypothetical protein
MLASNGTIVCCGTMSLRPSSADTVVLLLLLIA